MAPLSCYAKKQTEAAPSNWLVHRSVTGEREATLTLQLSVKLALKQIQSNFFEYEFIRRLNRLKSLRCAQTQQGDSLKVMAVQLAQH